MYLRIVSQLQHSLLTVVNTFFIEQELKISLSGHKADLRFLRSESANALSSLVIAGPACRVTAYCVLH